MRTTCSALTVAVVGIGLLAAGCSSGDSPEAAHTTRSGANDSLESFDSCTALTPEEIQRFGASPEGQPTDQGLGEVGCDFKGAEFNFGVLKAATDGQAYWEGQRHQFDEFDTNAVGSHRGFSGIALGGKGQGICTQGIYVGKGSVLVDITYKSNTMQGKDPCAKVMEIARVVEEKLPK